MRKDEREKRSGNTWWWNEQVQEAIDQKKKAFNTWCKNRSPENKNNYGKARNQRKVVAKAMKQAAEEEMNVLCDKPNKVFKLVKFMKKDGKDTNGGGCMKDKDGRLVVC